MFPPNSTKTIPLNAQQCEALKAHPGQPLEMLNPITNQTYVLLAAEQYQRVRPLLEVSPPAAPIPAIPPGIRRSQEAFWRDLPNLLHNPPNLGKWVCYHGDERIGIARTEVELIRECLRRGLKDDEYDLNVIESLTLPPWQFEEVEPGGHEVDELEKSHPSGRSKK
jgi:hypothetical protein